MRWIGTLLCAVGVGISAGAYASDYFILCEIDRTWDSSTSTTTRTVGSDSFGVTTESDGSTSYTLPFACDDGTGFLAETPASLQFRCKQTMGGITFDRFADIDRVSGEYRSGFANSGETGLVHFGNCRKADTLF